MSNYKNDYDNENTDKLDITEINRRYNENFQYEDNYKYEREEKPNNKGTVKKQKRNFTPILIFFVTLLFLTTVVLAINVLKDSKDRSDVLNSINSQKETEETEDKTTEATKNEEDETDASEGSEKITGSLTQDLNFRSSPGYDDNVIGSIPQGTHVEGYIDSSGWLKIEYNGQTGYIGKQFVE